MTRPDLRPDLFVRLLAFAAGLAYVIEKFGWTAGLAVVSFVVALKDWRR